MTSFWLLLTIATVAMTLISWQWQGNRLTVQAALPFHQWQIVDLTQPLTPNIPIWSGDPALEIQPWATYDKQGYFIHRLTIGEHSGTHWGTPNTFIADGKSADQFTAQELVMPAVVIDVQTQSAHSPDYRLSVAAIKAWETAHGQIPTGSIVILFTGWQAYWQDPARFFNVDAEGTSHFPGFSAAAVEFLIAARGIVGLGTDTHGADPGNDHTYGASTTIYQSNGMILECLAGLEKLPATGATLVIGGLPIQAGSGSPARVLAFIPPTFIPPK